MKLAVLGGTFDPIHIGHLIIADSIIETFDYDKVMFIPASMPPHKNISNMVSNVDRLEMVKLAVEDDRRFCVSDYEIVSGGLSYTINTLNYLYNTYKDIEGKIGLVIGYDLVEYFYKWKEAKKISEISDIIVVDRIANKNSCMKNIEEFGMRIVDNPRVDISSTMIRESIEKNKSVRYFLKESVYKYIIKNNLYK